MAKLPLLHFTFSQGSVSDNITIKWVGCGNSAVQNNVNFLALFLPTQTRSVVTAGHGFEKITQGRKFLF